MLSPSDDYRRGVDGRCRSHLVNFAAVDVASMTMVVSSDILVLEFDLVTVFI